MHVVNSLTAFRKRDAVHTGHVGLSRKLHQLNLWRVVRKRRKFRVKPCQH
jgi:hypothetical protein